MENNEIMNNEAAIETTEEIVENFDFAKSAKMGAIVGISMIVGMITYKYVGEPLIAKVKAKIAEKKENKIVVETDEVQNVDSAIE